MKTDVSNYPVNGKNQQGSADFLALLNTYLNAHSLMLEKSQFDEILGVSVLRAWDALPDCRIEGLGSIVEYAWQWEQKRQWVIGDIILIGGNKFGEEFNQYLPAGKTLVNWASICHQYPHHERCFNLSFSHYAEVAYLADKRARANLLAQAAEKHWTVADLRTARNLDAGNPTPQLDYEFTIWNSISSPIKLWNGGVVDKAQYEELVAKYGRGELSIEIKILGRKS